MGRKGKQLSLGGIIVLFLILGIISSNKDYILNTFNDLNKSSYDENQKIINEITTNMKENLNKTNK